MKGLTICVQYDDLLEINLVRNMRHMTECVVVTAPHDERTQRVVSQVPGARCLVTDAFYRDGAKFNKGLAMEEGFDELGRDGHILIWDADIQLPSEIRYPTQGVRKDILYGCSRVILDDPLQWSPEFNWSMARATQEFTFAGFFQLFYASDPHLRTRPWYDTKFIHAGGGDHYFQSHWPANKKAMLPIKVLHLGPRDTNWFGRVTHRIDGLPVGDEIHDRRLVMESFLRAKGWCGRTKSNENFQEKLQ